MAAVLMPPRVLDARYAIYLAPAPNSELWRYGSTLLGYDAAIAEEIPQPVIHGVDPSDWKSWTQQPRTYGFHATLKAPFRLAPGHSPGRLAEAIERFCAGQRPFEIPLRLEIVDERDGEGFLALVPRKIASRIIALERKTVVDFDFFRAGLTPVEMARRKPGSLTKRQRGYLERYGYPFVLDEFRLHFSLTGRVPDANRIIESVRAAINNYIGKPSILVDALVLFEQAEPDLPFRIVGRFPFGGR